MPTGILVTGGTGTVGRLLTDRLLADGHDVRAVSRRTGVDLVTGTGLDAVLESIPGRVGKAFRDGSTLVPGLPGGTQTWRQFLEAQ